MSDIKCPMCGKANPAEAEVCKYCNARLKPLVAPGQKSAAAPDKQSGGGSDTDWLRSLTGRGAPSSPADPAPAAPPDSAPEPEETGDEPDWLARIRQKTKEEEDAVSPIGRPPKVEPAAANAPTIPAGPVPPVPPAPPSEDDWLKSLRSAHVEAEPPVAPPPPPSSSADEDLDNDAWLRSLNTRLENNSGYTPARASSSSEDKAAPADIPDWLKGSAAGTPSAEAKDESSHQLPAPSPSEEDSAAELNEWLKSFSSGAGQVPPAAAPEPPALEPEEPEAAPADVPDWLKAFAAEQPAVTPPAAAQPPTSPVQESATSLPEPEAAPADVPDWLKAFAAEPPAVTPPAAAQPPASPVQESATSLPEPEAAPADVPDWLKAFAAEQPAVTPPAAAQPPASPVQESATGLPEPDAAPADMPDWLRSFAAEQPTVTEPAAVQPPPPPAQESATSLPEPEAAPADMPDWLRSFAAEQPTVTPPASPVQESATSLPEPDAAPADMPDWLRSFAAEQPAVTEPAAVTPPASPVQESATSLPEPDTAPADMPDWLRSFAAEQPAVTPPAAVQPPPPPLQESATSLPEPEAAPADMPDWLRSFAAEQPAVTETAAAQPAEEPLESPAQPEAAAPADVPDWLAAIASQQPAAPAPAADQPTSLPAQEPSASPADMPDWLKAFASEQPAASMEMPLPAAETQGEAAAVPADVPDWLKDFGAPPASQQSLASEPRDTGALLGGVNRHTGELILPASMAKNEDIPEWLKSYSQRESAEPAASSQPEPQPEPEPEPTGHVSPFSESNLPDWMYNDQSAFQLPAGDSLPPAEPPSAFEGPGIESSGPARPFAGQEVSHWLDAPAAEQAASDEAAKSRQGDLEMAPLPAWLQAMRPVESAAPQATDTVDDQRIEKAGPLAGLRGILRGEDLVTQYQKPPTYSVKLRVSEPQTTRAGLLEAVVADEVKAQAGSSESQAAPQLAVRIATGLALIALILIVILFGPKPLTPAALSEVDPQAIAINRMVEGLAPGAPVLVAVDYTGGLAGELRIVSQPVLQHLMAKNVRIVFVSTQVEGPALAESLFSSARLNGVSGYPLELKANLGYLLGGSTALKALAASPLRTSLPTVWGGDRTWNQPALQGLNQITDFSQVILLTDTPENARDWVEQAQPELAKKNVPLIVISSAQAAPMLRPYQQSGQITALLSGLTGGTAYEQIRQVRGDGTTSYNAYLAGVLAMTLFILMGGIVSLLSKIFSPKPKRKV